MPAKKRPGVTGVYVELPDAQVSELESLAERLPLGNKADHIRLAVARHLAHPPTVAVPALPPAEMPAAEGKPKRGRPKKK